MLKTIISLLGILLISGCLKPKPEELEFFNVTLENPMATPGKFGEISLQGSILGLINEKVEAYGFLYAESPADLVLNSAKVHTIQFSGPKGNGDFDATLLIGSGVSLYFKTFAKLKDRVVYSEVPKPYGFGDVVILVDSAAIINNEATVQGLLIGPQTLGAKVSGHGHVFSETQDLPALGKPDCRFTNLGETSTDYVFASRLEDLNFNTTYHYRGYAIVEQDTVYSKKVYSFHVRGGWKRTKDFPMVYQDGTAVGLMYQGQAIAFAGFGANKVGPAVISDYPRKFWQFDPGADNGNGNWIEKEPSSMPGELPRTNVGSFAIQDTVYTLCGEYNDLGFFILRDLQKYAIGSDGPWKRVTLSDTLRRTGVVAFALKGKGYVGAGQYRYKDANNMWIYKELNDFWEYDPQTGGWRQVASMPLQLSPGGPIYYESGRREATAFTIGDNAFVGGGEFFGMLLRDFWRFTPPDSLQPLGHWDQVPSFEGSPRIQAVSFASDTKGYYGLGAGLNNTIYDDFWAFDPGSSDPWKKINPFPGGKRKQALAFSLLNKGYVGTGIRKEVQNDMLQDVLFDDFWMYVPDSL